MAAIPSRMIDLADLAVGSRPQHKNALRRFFRETSADITDVDALTEYAADLPRSSRAFLRAAVRLYTDGDGIVGLRDKVLLGLLVGAGLRREEVANLRLRT